MIKRNNTNAIECIINAAKEKAKVDMKKIVLPEANDVRILKAAKIVKKEKIAIPILVGVKEEILKIAKENDIDLKDIMIQDVSNEEKTNEYASMLYELRKSKGMTQEIANSLVKEPVYFATCMVKKGEAHGMVSGAIHSTADTLRPALQIIKAKDIDGKVSSFFLMDVPNSKYNGAYIFSDCGLVEYPSSEELANIAVQSAASYKSLIGKEPVVAFLSYSTYGSASSESVENVQKAKEILQKLNVDFEFDGELQVDSALEPNVAKIKAPGCNISGRANVFIFPNIDAGNIGYKLVERFAMATAIGPLTQGLAKPVNDLSRGCKVEDIVVAIAVTAIQSN